MVKKKVEIDKSKPKKVKKGSKEKEMKVLVTTMGVIIVLLLIVSFGGDYSSKFTYESLEFEKQAHGDLLIYNTQVPIRDSVGSISGYVSANFREDPRDLEDIPVEIEGGIGFILDRGVYLSIDPLTEQCEDSGVAIINLGGIFLPGAGISTKLGSLDAEHAEREGIPHVTCENSASNTIITIQQGDETSIKKGLGNCYQIYFKECEVLRAVEKFQLEVLEGYVTY